MIGADWQFELDDGVNPSILLGSGTPYHVYEFTHDKPDIRANTTARAREDGTNRGRDWLGGTTASLELGVHVGYDPGGVLDQVSRLRGLWYGDQVRREPGKRAILRAKRPGRDPVRMYGRPGSFKVASMENVAAGYVPVVAEFDCDDGYFYSDAEYTLSVPYVPASVGGLIGPLSGPWVATTAGVSSGRLTVGGECPAWLGWRPRGPIVDPVIEVVGRWSATLRGQINYDQSVTVDPAPWQRTARANGGGNWSGKFTADSTRMSRMLVPPGASQVLLRGIDPSGTASLDVFWRSVWASY